jgi:hypothetical protein
VLTHKPQKEKKMPEPKEKRIPIKTINGRQEGHKLIECFFTQSSGGHYNFHAQDGQIKGREITVGRTFRFQLDDAPGVFWRLILDSDADEILSGRWNDKEDPAQEDGTYQAQAGGNVEDAASACA